MSASFIGWWVFASIFSKIEPRHTARKGEQRQHHHG